MALLDIHVLGSPILRQDTEKVGQVTPELRRLVDDMFDTMDKAKGVGLAAPQVGRRERLAVVEVDEQRLVVINPEIILKEGSVRGEEGCLSIPELYANIDRFALHHGLVAATTAAGGFACAWRRVVDVAPGARW